MNQTIHTYQVLHAYANRCDARKRRAQIGEIGPRQPDACNGKQGHFARVRKAASNFLVLVPLIVAELGLGAVAFDGGFADVLKNTAQLLALAQPF